MIQLTYDNRTQLVDIERDGQITSSELLNTAVIISLFSRRRADDGDSLPEPNGPLEGWWADGLGPSDPDGDRIGSKLWLLNRSKTTQQTLNLAKVFALEAVQWLVDDGIASTVDVAVWRATTAEIPELAPGNDALAFRVEITRPTMPTTRWSGVWAAHLGEL